MSERCGPIVLVGMRGSGKSTVAAALAKRLRLHWVDTDSEVVARDGRTIADIFASDGEAAFRRLESQVLDDWLDGGFDGVIATGGGIVTVETNRRRIAKSSQTVWLDAPVSVLCRRIRGDDATVANRPSLTDRGSLEDEMRVMAERRVDWYREVADLRVDAATAGSEEIADLITRWCGGSG